jgi:hypothetical protein
MEKAGIPLLYRLLESFFTVAEVQILAELVMGVQRVASGLERS